MPQECRIPCDYCDQKPAFWFGDTSVAVCSKRECQNKNTENWERHCSELDEQFGEENGYFLNL